MYLLRNQNNSYKKISTIKPLFHNFIPLEAYNDSKDLHRPTPNHISVCQIHDIGSIILQLLLIKPANQTNILTCGSTHSAEILVVWELWVTSSSSETVTRRGKKMLKC